MSGRDHKLAIREAAEAHTNLNVFAAIVTLLEGGHLYGGGAATHSAEERIIRICKAEQSKWLRRYDAAVARESKP